MTKRGEVDFSPNDWIAGFKNLLSISLLEHYSNTGNITPSRALLRQQVSEQEHFWGEGCPNQENILMENI